MNETKAPPPARKGPSIGLVLTALLMVLVSVGVVAWQVPLAACPNCKTPAPAPAVEPPKETQCPTCKTPAVTVDRFKPAACPNCKTPTSAPSAPTQSAPPSRCITCDGEGKISYVKRWGYDRIKLDLNLDKISSPLK